MVGDIFQPTHLLFVLVVALLVLGPKKLPEVGRQLGNGIRDFRAAINGERSEPEEVHAPYEQAVTDPPAEHEFAHEAPAPATVADHEFGHDQPAAETAAEDEFAHQPAAEATPNGHEFAHEPETPAVEGEAPAGETAHGGHEFAYETSEASDKRSTDPPA
jgi:sec-independent protein translocase protein TatA